MFCYNNAMLPSIPYSCPSPSNVASILLLQSESHVLVHDVPFPSCILSFLSLPFNASGRTVNNVIVSSCGSSGCVVLNRSVCGCCVKSGGCVGDCSIRKGVVTIRVASHASADIDIHHVKIVEVEIK